MPFRLLFSLSNLDDATSPSEEALADRVVVCPHCETEVRLPLFEGLLSEPLRLAALMVDCADCGQGYRC